MNGKKKPERSSFWNDDFIRRTVPQRRPLSIIFLILALSTCLILAPYAHTAEIYKWVDENGRAHYGDRPMGQTSEKVIVNEPGPYEETYANELKKQLRLLDVLDEERQEQDKQNARYKEERESRAANCAMARNNLNNIQTARFLYEATGDPFNPRVLSHEERARETTKAETMVRHWCD
jgi:hypothetical protein